MRSGRGIDFKLSATIVVSCPIHSMPLPIASRQSRSLVLLTKLIERPKDNKGSMMMSEGMGFVALFGQFPEVAVDVVGIATLGLQLNGPVFDTEIRGDSVLDQLE
jgi:hypothetical protein